MNKLTKDEIKHIASLAKIKFTDEELNEFDKEFNEILGYVSMIQECNTEGIEFEHNLDDYEGEVLMEDEPRKGLSKEDALRNATEGRNKGGFIVTSKIVNKE